MNFNFETELGNAMAQAVAGFDGSPQSIEEMLDFSRIVRYFALVEFPHPDSPKVLARYVPIDGWDLTPEREALTAQKSALLDILEVTDVTADNPSPTALLLVLLWHKLQNGEAIPARAQLILDPAIPVEERMRNLALLV